MSLLLALLAGCTVPAQVSPPASPTPAPLRVWIDTDPSVGEPDRDVDDGVALLQALNSPELDVVGVSIVFGNAPLDRADPIGRELVAAWAPGLPVHTGAAGPDLSPTPASEALVAALAREPLTVLVLGPATNLAAALRARPDLADRIVEVVAVAGRQPGQRFTTGTTSDRGHRDFNFEQDPEAFRVLLEARVPVTLAPFEISSQVWVTARFLDGLEGHPRAGRLVDPARGWLDLWVRSFAVDGFNPFDTLAVSHVVAPELERCWTGRATIEIGPDDRTLAAMQGGGAGTKPYLLVRPDGVGAEVTYCAEVRAEAFLHDLRARLTR